MADTNPTCKCGCGRPVTFATRNVKWRGIVKGQPYDFIQGHTTRTGHGEYVAGGYKDAKRMHVVIAEKALGKPLPEGAEVHHVNGNKKDNRNTNLVICQDAAYHRLLHMRQRIYEAGGDPNTDRICSRCHEVKHMDEFYKDTTRIGGVGGKCRPCGIISAEESYERRRTNPKKLYTHDRVFAAGGDPATQLQCSRCVEVKDKDEFPQDRSHHTGYYHACKACARAKTAAYTERKRLERGG